jgi:2-dehydro-3-deoxyphosphooctonate aldolase (KDO 8-P synthase)
VDKANRTSLRSFRGLGLAEGLRILARVKEETGLPVLVDAHEPAQVPQIARVADVLQVPAFCAARPTARRLRPERQAVNVKKGQFMAPRDMRHVLSSSA